MTLLKISLVRALATKCAITKVEARDKDVIFSMEKPCLEVWSEVFASLKGISMRPLGQGMAIVYRLPQGTTAENAALKVLDAYIEAENKSKEENEDDEQKSKD